MNPLWDKLLRGECSAEELETSHRFCELVISKVAKRRGLLPEQVRCSLERQTLEDPESLGPDDTYRPKHYGLH